MTKLHVKLSVKFREFGITFGTVKKDLYFVVDIPNIILPIMKIAEYNDKGVYLLIETTKESV